MEPTPRLPEAPGLLCTEQPEYHCCLQGWAEPASPSAPVRSLRHASECHVCGPQGLLALQLQLSHFSKIPNNLRKRLHFSTCQRTRCMRLVVAFDLQTSSMLMRERLKTDTPKGEKKITCSVRLQRQNPVGIIHVFPSSGLLQTELKLGHCIHRTVWYKHLLFRCGVKKEMNERVNECSRLGCEEEEKKIRLQSHLQPALKTSGLPIFRAPGTCQCARSSIAR